MNLVPRLHNATVIKPAKIADTVKQMPHIPTIFQPYYKQVTSTSRENQVVYDYMDMGDVEHSDCDENLPTISATSVDDDVVVRAVDQLCRLPLLSSRSRTARSKTPITEIAPTREPVGEVSQVSTFSSYKNETVDS